MLVTRAMPFECFQIHPRINPAGVQNRQKMGGQKKKHDRPIYSSGLLQTITQAKRVHSSSNLPSHLLLKA
jgi:hypothetical protein